MARPKRAGLGLYQPKIEVMIITAEQRPRTINKIFKIKSKGFWREISCSTNRRWKVFWGLKVKL